jgi:hypothetical protein
VELRRDVAAYALITSYVLLTIVVAAHFGKTYWAGPLRTYLRLALGFAAVVLIGAIAAGLALTFARERPRSPLRRALQLLAGWFTPARGAGLALYVAVGLFLGAFTTMKTLLPALHPFAFDPALAMLDRAIHLGHEPWRLLHPLVGRTDATRALELAYGPAWLLINSTVLFAMLALQPDGALRRRFVLAFLLAWILNGTLVAGLFMSAGPAFYAEVTGDPRPFGSLVRYLTADASGLFSAALQQKGLWTAYLTDSAKAGAGISAFPSMHVTMATLSACAGAALDRRLGALLAGFAGLIVVGSVHLGWHYAVDSYYAAASTLALWWAVGRWVRRREADALPGRLSPAC